MMAPSSRMSGFFLDCTADDPALFQGFMFPPSDHDISSSFDPLDYVERTIHHVEMVTEQAQYCHTDRMPQYSSLGRWVMRR